MTDACLFFCSVHALFFTMQITLDLNMSKNSPRIELSKNSTLHQRGNLPASLTGLPYLVYIILGSNPNFMLQCRFCGPGNKICI